MPFQREFNNVFQLGIKEAAKKAGAYAERLDEQTFQESMLERIYNQISKADVIVADMTGQNANVFYEVGYAHALDRPVLLIAQDAASIPFDLKHRLHLIYSKDDLKGLKDELAKRIRWALAQANETPLSSPVQTYTIYQQETEAVAGESTIAIRFWVQDGIRPLYSFSFGVFNHLDEPLQISKMLLFTEADSDILPYATDIGEIEGVRINSEYSGGFGWQYTLSKQDYPDTVYPYSAEGFELRFHLSLNNITLGSEHVLLRIYTGSGFRDVQLRAEKVRKPKPERRREPSPYVYDATIDEPF